MDTLNKFIKENKWTVLSFCVNEDGYYTLIGGAASQLTEIWETLTDQNNESETMGNFLETKEGAWIPVAYGNSYLESLENLNQKLFDISKDVRWELAVLNFYFWFGNVFDKSPLSAINIELKREGTPFSFDNYDSNGMLTLNNKECDRLLS